MEAVEALHRVFVVGVFVVLWVLAGGAIASDEAEGAAWGQDAFDLEAGAGVGMAPSASIHIQGDDEFEEHPAVRSGSGTAEDPYRISDWMIVGTGSHGVLLEGTSAHVVVENVTIVGGVSSGVVLVDAVNVVVRDVHVWSALSWGVSAQDAGNVVLERVLIGHAPSGVSALNPESGIIILGSEGFSLSNVTVAPAHHPLRLSGSTDVDIEHTTFEGGDAGQDIRLPDSSGVRIVNSVIGEDVVVEGEQSDVEFLHNAFVGEGGFAFFTTRPGVYEDFLVCGNVFEGETELPSFLSLGEIEEFRFVGNHVKDKNNHLSLSGAGLVVERNVFENGSDESFNLVLRGDGEVTLVENNFVNNTWPLWVDGVSADARENWWNDQAGPDVMGEGPGEEEVVVVSEDGEIVWDPWLEEPADAGPGAVDCGVPDRESGALEEPRIPVSASGAVGVGPLVVDEKVGPHDVKAEARAGASVQVGPFPLPT